jgi:peptidoglycan-associated lipoprotein
MGFQRCVLLFATAAACACSAQPQPRTAAPLAAAVPAPAEPRSVPPPAEKPGDNSGHVDVIVSAEIKAACRISDGEARFAFDSAKVRSGDQPVLNKLVQCFTTGKLSGRTMSLAGHADARGEAEYNMVLGGKRADNVKSYLVNQGLGEGQAETTSRGEMDAMGADEVSWAEDRRVDVILVN